MERRKPHEIVNRLFEARDTLRSNPTLETALITRIRQMPEDNYCRNDREAFQLGAGYAHISNQGEQLIEPVHFESEYTMAILQVYFAIRPINRYKHEHEVHEQHKQIHEAVITQNNRLPDHLDPYEVSGAAMFLEGYLTVSTYHESFTSK